ncbi:MAG: class I SAM-dependent methyltransferase, partial [Bacteroidota bacterium]
EEVIATDGNLRILEGTIPNSKISFEVGQEDTISAKSGSVDLVTVGQALHMLNLEDFYSEVRRVVRPGGVLAVWGFGIPRLGMEFDRLLNRFYSETLSGYWPAGWVHLQQRYKNIPFPFKNVMDERVEAEYYWKFEDWMSFLESWTAVRQYTKDHGGSPVEVLRPLFSQLWGGHETKKVSFTFFVKKGLVI